MKCVVREPVIFVLTAILLTGVLPVLNGQVAVHGEKVFTMDGKVIHHGVVLITNGKIAFVGPSQELKIPEGIREISGKVVTPGLIDVHSVVGLSGYFNSPHDQDQLEHTFPVQPELRAVDAYNPHEKLVDWIRGFGITTLHTGHAPGELISGQTMIVKTIGNTVQEAVVRERFAVASTLAESARKSGRDSPGSRSKMVSLLREHFIKAQEYLRGRAREEQKRPERNLRLEVIGHILEKKIPMLVTAHRAQDIASVLRFAEEFDIKIILDGAAESYLLIEEIKRAQVPVILHPTMVRMFGELENASFETASELRKHGIPLAIQSGYEAYVPKTRVVLFEAGLLVANGMQFQEALATITIDAARILGISDRVGSLSVGKDGDVAVFDGDPFEYVTHCVTTIIEGKVVSEQSH